MAYRCEDDALEERESNHCGGLSFLDSGVSEDDVLDGGVAQASHSSVHKVFVLMFWTGTKDCKAQCDVLDPFLDNSSSEV